MHCNEGPSGTLKCQLRSGVFCGLLNPMKATWKRMQSHMKMMIRLTEMILDHLEMGDVVRIVFLEPITRTFILMICSKSNT